MNLFSIYKILYIEIFNAYLQILTVEWCEKKELNVQNQRDIIKTW